MLVRRAALTLALVLASSAASAQPSDGDKATARALAQSAQDALEKKDFTTAADHFERARQIFPAPTLSLGLARAQVGLGKWVAAQETLNRILREGVPAGSPPAFAKAVADARKELDALEPRIPGVVINVKGAPAPKVTLDGAHLPNAVLGINRLVDPGPHNIRAEADGFVAAQTTVTVVERKIETVTLTLVPGQAAPPPVTPPPPVKPPPPVAPPPAAQPPVAQPPATQPPAQQADSGGSVRKTIGFVGIGVGAAGLAMGAITGGLAIPKHSALVPLCPQGHCPASQQSALDSYHLMTNLSTAGFVAGGVLAAAGIVLVVTAPKGGQARDAWVAPVVGPGFAGVEGRF